MKAGIQRQFEPARLQPGPSTRLWFWDACLKTVHQPGSMLRSEAEEWLHSCGISSYNPETDEAIGSKSVAALDRVVPPVRSISEECVQCTILPGCPGCRHEFYCQSFSRSFQLFSRFCMREARSALSSGCRLWPLFGESILSSQDRRMLSPAFGWRLEEPERLTFKCCAEVKTSWDCKTHSGTLMILEYLCIVTKPEVSVSFYRT